MNVIFKLRIIPERAIKIKEDVYRCFINYVKSFVKIRYKEMFDLFDNLDIFVKYIRIISNLYERCKLQYLISKYRQMSKELLKFGTVASEYFCFSMVEELKHLEFLRNFLWSSKNHKLLFSC